MQCVGAEVSALVYKLADYFRGSDGKLSSPGQTGLLRACRQNERGDVVELASGAPTGT